MTGVRVTGKRNTKIKYDYSEKAQYVTNIKKCEVYRNSNNLTKKQQHRPMGWQIRAERDLTAVTTQYKV